MHFKQAKTLCKHPAIRKKRNDHSSVHKYMCIYIWEHSIMTLRRNFGDFALLGHQIVFLITKIRNKVVFEVAALRAASVLLRQRNHRDWSLTPARQRKELGREARI